MKRLTILKNIIDFIWILTCIPGAILILILVVLIFVNPGTFNISSGIEISSQDIERIEVKILLMTLLFCFLTTIYCFYLFRKTLRYFQQVKPFDDFVINTYHKIGKLLIIIGIASSILFFLLKIMIESRFELTLGATPYLMIICLGLFFTVLSETFKVAKYHKQENDLTI